MIADLIEGPVSIKALVTKADPSRNAKGTPYLSLLLEDSSGVLDAKFWNISEERCLLYKPGMVVEAKGDLIYYRNAPQLRIYSLTILPEEKIYDYVREAPLSAEQMQKEIDALVDQIEDEVLYTLVIDLLEKHKEEYYSYPAAVRNHHNYIGGLAYHSLSMARLVEPLVKQYPYLDKDLLIAGALLHDIGKIDEYTSAVLPEYSVQGNLIGHISLLAGELEEEAKRLGYENEEQVMLLKHMILSHHGKTEFGSPVLPLTPEAQVLATIDNLDAKLEMMNQSLQQTRPGTFGPRNFALENRMIYHRKFHEEEAEEEEEAAPVSF